MLFLRRNLVFVTATPGTLSIVMKLEMSFLMIYTVACFDGGGYSGSVIRFSGQLSASIPYLFFLWEDAFVGDEKRQRFLGADGPLFCT